MRFRKSELSVKEIKGSMVLVFATLGIPLFLVCMTVCFCISKLFGTKMPFQLEGFGGLASALGFSFYCGVFTALILLIETIHLLIRN